MNPFGNPMFMAFLQSIMPQLQQQFGSRPMAQMPPTTRPQAAMQQFGSGGNQFGLGGNRMRSVGSNWANYGNFGNRMNPVAPSFPGQGGGQGMPTSFPGQNTAVPGQQGAVNPFASGFPGQGQGQGMPTTFPGQSGAFPGQQQQQPSGYPQMGQMIPNPAVVGGMGSGGAGSLPQRPPTLRGDYFPNNTSPTLDTNIPSNDPNKLMA